MKTDRSDVAITFSEKEVENLPLFNRKLHQPGTAQPRHVRQLGWQHTSAENPQGGIQIMVNGQHFSGTSFQLDGT